MDGVAILPESQLALLGNLLLLYPLRLFERAKLRRHFYFCAMQKFFNG
jgi:hypothetical protein